ncbi:MAG TPA: LysR family transcriptional regulator [Rhizobiales bacterium]|nr:LysR family transcriptional regulator [Hyphomicrobiales bacterium]
MNMGDIPIIIAVAETQGFASAARRLGVSKSAVSKRIAVVEQRLGAQLFHRSTRHISLTEVGARFYEHAIRSYEAAQEAEDCVSALQSKPKGKLKINVPMSFGRLHISPLIADFLKIYPDIEIELIMDDRVVDLIEEGFDLAIRGGTLKDSSLVARKIAPITNILVASPDYIQAYGEPSSVKELMDHNCLQYTYSRDFQEWVFLSNGTTLSFRPNGNFRVNNGEALKETILNGLGIGRLPTFTVGGDLANGRLVQVLADYSMPRQMLYAIYPERRHLPPKVREFIDFLLERLGGDMPPWDQL